MAVRSSFAEQSSTTAHRIQVVTALPTGWEAVAMLITVAGGLSHYSHSLMR
jgi:hypothetical protein